MPSTVNYSRFHLRRVGPPATRNESSNLMCFTRPVTFIGRNPGQVDYVISSSNFVQNAIISRRHARVVRSVESSSFRIHDDSRNGVFVNNVKISGSVILNEGDCVTFGHPMGEKLQPGAWVRQPDSEYQFVFERCECTIPLVHSAEGTVSPQSASQFSGEPIPLSPMTLGSVENLVPVTGEGCFRAPAPLIGRSLSLKRVSRKSVTSAEIGSRSCVVGSAISCLGSEQVNPCIPSNSDTFQTLNSTVSLTSDEHSSDAAVSCSSSNTSGTVLSVKLSDVMPGSLESTVFDSTPNCDPTEPVVHFSASNPVQSDGDALCSLSAGNVRQISSSDVDEAVICSKESHPGTVATPSGSSMSLSEMDLFSSDPQSVSDVKPESQSVEAFSGLLPEMTVIERHSKENEGDTYTSEPKVAQTSICMGFESAIQFQHDEEKEDVVKEIESTDHGDRSEIREEMLSVHEENHQKSVQEQLKNGDIMKQIGAEDVAGMNISQEMTSMDAEGSCVLIDEKSTFKASQVIPFSGEHLVIENYTAEAGDQVAVPKTREYGNMFVCTSVAQDVELSYADNCDGGNLFGDKDLILVESKESISEKVMEETTDNKEKSSEDFKEIRDSCGEEETGKVDCDEILECERNNNILTEDLRVMEMVVQADGLADNLMQTVAEAGKENVRTKTEQHFTNDLLECTSICDISYSELTAWNPDLTITEQLDKIPEQKTMDEVEVHNQSNQHPLEVAENATELAELTKSEIPAETVASLEIANKEVSVALCIAGSAESDLQAAAEVTSAEEYPTSVEEYPTSVEEYPTSVKEYPTSVEEYPTSVAGLTFRTVGIIENDLSTVTAEESSIDVATDPVDSFECARKETTTDGIITQEINTDLANMVLAATEGTDKNLPACFIDSGTNTVTDIVEISGLVDEGKAGSSDFTMAETSDAGLVAEIIATSENANIDIATEENGTYSANGECFVEADVKEESDGERSCAAEKLIRPKTVAETNVANKTAMQETDTSDAEETIIHSAVIQEEITVSETGSAVTLDSVGEVVRGNTLTEETAALQSDVVSEEMVTVNNTVADTMLRDMAEGRELLTEETITDADFLVNTVTNDVCIDDRTPEIKAETSTILVEETVCAKTITSENTLKGNLTETGVAAESSFFMVTDEAKDKHVMMDSHTSFDLVPASFEDSYGGNFTLSATKDDEINLPACFIDSGANTVTDIVEMSGLGDEEKAGSSESWQRMMTAFVPLHTSTPLDDSEGLCQEKSEGEFDAESVDVETFFSGGADIRTNLEHTKGCLPSEVCLLEDSLKVCKSICPVSEFIHPGSSTLIGDDQTKNTGPFETSEVSGYACEVKEQRPIDNQQPLPCAEQKKHGDVVPSEEQVLEDAGKVLTTGELCKRNAIEDLVETEEQIPENATEEKVQVDATRENVEIEQVLQNSTGELVKTQGEHPGNVTESENQVPENGNAAVEMVGNDNFVPEDAVGKLETEDEVPEDVAEPEAVAEIEVAAMTQDVAELETASKQEDAAELEVSSQPENSAELEIAIQPEDTAEMERAIQPEDAAERETASQPEDTAELETAIEPEDTAELEMAIEPEDTAELETAIQPEDAAERETASQPEDAAELEIATQLETANQPEDTAESEDAAEMEIANRQDDALEKEAETNEWVEEDSTQDLVESSEKMSENAAEEEIVDSVTLELVKPEGLFLECATEEAVCELKTNLEVRTDASGKETKQQVEDSVAEDFIETDEQVPEGARKKLESDEEVPDDATQEVFGTENQLAEDGIGKISEIEEHALIDASGKIMRVIKQVLEDAITDVVETTEKLTKDENGEILHTVGQAGPSYVAGEMVIIGKAVEDVQWEETGTEEQVPGDVCKVAENDEVGSAITPGESETCLPDEVARKRIETEVQQPEETGEVIRNLFFNAIELLSVEESENTIETVVQVSKEATGTVLAQLSKDMAQTEAGEEGTVENIRELLEDVLQTEVGLSEEGSLGSHEELLEDVVQTGVELPEEQTVENHGKLLKDVVQTGAGLPGERTVVNSLQFSEDVVETEARLPEEGSEELVDNEMHLSGESTVKASLEQPGITVEAEASLPEQMNELKTSEEFTEEVVQTVTNSLDTATLEVVQSDAKLTDKDNVLQNEHSYEDVLDAGTAQVMIHPSEDVTEGKFVGSGTTGGEVVIESKKLDEGKEKPTERVSDIVSVEMDLVKLPREVVTETLPEALSSVRTESPKDGNGSSQMMIFGGSSQQGTLEHKLSENIPPSTPEMSDRKLSQIPPVTEQVIIKKEYQCQGAAFENNYQRAVPPCEKSEDGDDSLNHTVVEEGQFDDVDSDETDASTQVPKENTSSSSPWSRVVCGSPACPPSILGGLGWMPSSPFSYPSALCRQMPGVLSPSVQHSPVFSDARKRKRPLEPDFGWKRSRLEQSAGIGELPSSLPVSVQERVGGCGSTSKRHSSPTSETTKPASKPKMESNELSSRKLDSNCSSLQLNSCRNEMRPDDDTSVRETVEEIFLEAEPKNKNGSGVDSTVHAYVNSDISLPEKAPPMIDPDLVVTVHRTHEVVVTDRVNDMVMLEQMTLGKETQENKPFGLVKENVIENIEEVFDEEVMDGRSCVQQLSGDTVDELKIGMENNGVEQKESRENPEKEFIVEDIMKSTSEEMTNTDAERSENCFEGQKVVTRIDQLITEAGELQDVTEGEMYTQQNTDHEKLAEKLEMEDLNLNVCYDEQLVDEAMVKTISDVNPLEVGTEQHRPEVLLQEGDAHISGPDIVAESISETALVLSHETEETFSKQNDERPCGGQVTVECLTAKSSDETDIRSIDFAQCEKGFPGNCHTALHVGQSDEPSPLDFDVPVNYSLDSSASCAVALEREGPFTSTQLPGEEGHDKEWLPPSSPQFSISGTQEDIFAEPLIDDDEHKMHASCNSPVPFNDSELHPTGVDFNLQKESDFVISQSLPLTGRSLNSDGVNVDTDTESLHLYLEMSQDVCTQPRASQSDYAAVVKTERVSSTIEMAVVLSSAAVQDGNADRRDADEEKNTHIAILNKDLTTFMDYRDNVKMAAVYEEGYSMDSQHEDKGSRSSDGDDCADELNHDDDCFTNDDHQDEGCTAEIESQNDEGIAAVSSDECCSTDVVRLNEVHLEKESNGENSATDSKQLNDGDSVASDEELTDRHCRENAGSSEKVLLLNCGDVTSVSNREFKESNLRTEHQIWISGMKDFCTGLAIKDFSFADIKNVLTEETGSSQNVLTEEMGSSQNVVTEETGSSENVLAEEMGSSENVLAEEMGCSQNVLAEEMVSSQNVLTEVMGSSQDMIATEDISQSAHSQTVSKLSASGSRNNAVKNEDNVNSDNVNDNVALPSVSLTDFVTGTETIDRKIDDDTQNVAGKDDGLVVCKEVICDDHVNRYSLDVGNTLRDVEYIDDKEMRQVEGWQPENDESKSLRTSGLASIAVNTINLDNVNVICNDSKVAKSNSVGVNIANETSITDSNFETESGQVVDAFKVQHQSPPEPSFQDLNLEDPAGCIVIAEDEMEECPLDLDLSNEQQKANTGQEENDDKNKLEPYSPFQREESFSELDVGTKNGVSVQDETLPSVAHGTKSANVSLLVRSESPDFDISLPIAISGSCSDESTNKEEQEEDEVDEDKDKDDDEDNEDNSRSSSPDIFSCASEQQRCTDLQSVAQVMDPPAFDDSIDDFTPPTVDLSCIDSDHDEPTMIKLQTAEDDSYLKMLSRKVFSDSFREQSELAAKGRKSEGLSKKRQLSDPDSGLSDSKRLKNQSSPGVFETEKATFSDFHLPEPRFSYLASSAASDDVSGSNESSANLYSQSLFSQDQETSVSQVTKSGSRRRSQVVSGVLQKIKAKLETKTDQIEIPGTETRSSSPEPVEPGRESSVPSASHGNEVNSSVEKSIFQSYSAIVKELKTIFQNDLPGIKSQRLLSWKNEISTMESVQSLPKTIIAVVGETGAGKSSLLNALLDHADVLPTSGMRACTAVVVQVAENPHSNSYEAEIEFLSEEEWMEELQILLRELTGRSGKVRTQQPDQNSDSIVAWSKIRAVYGTFSNSVTLEQLSLQKTVTRWLGKTKHIIHTSPREFKKEIDRYIESRDVGSGGDYWPIVKHVRTRIPNCGICSSGAVLVDMPGMGDSNAARNNIAKQYMQNCNSVWVVSNIHRAVDNKIAKDLLGEHFRRQLLMDGQYSSVSFICTKTDIVNTSETISELHMEGESDVLLNEISDLEEKILRRDKESRTVAQKMKVLHEKINALKREKISLSTDVEELTQVLKDEEEIDDEVSDTLSQLQQTVVSKDEILQSANTDLEYLRFTEANNQKEVTDSNRLIRQRRRQLRELCAKARNEYSTRQIRRDFRAGIKEVQKKTRQKTGNAASDDEMDSNGSDDDDDDDSSGICRTAENLKVFCVSSTEYLKLTGKLKKDGPAEVFQSVEDTGIPAVVNYTHTLTRVRRKQGVERLGKSLGRFVFEVLSYVSDGGTKDHATREAAEVIFEEHTAELRNNFTQITSDIVQQIGDLFQQQLLPKIDLGVQSAVSSAPSTVVNWGVKSNKENRTAGGLPWSTYKATTSRSGIFRSPTYGPIDFNEDLASPMYDTLTVAWNKIFNCQMCTIMDSLKQNVLSALKKFCQDLHLELDRVPVNSNHLARIKLQVLTSSENRLSEAIAQLKDFITQRQRDVNRVITPSIQTDMQPAYSYCSSEVGKGQFQRMKTVMVDHVGSTKQTMMSEAASKIIQQLWQLQTEIEVRLNDVFRLLIQDLSALYEPIWESRNPLLLQRPQFINDILGLKDQMFSFFEKIDFRLDAPELLIFDKTSAFMTAKKEKSPTMKDFSARKLGYSNSLLSPEHPYVSSHKEAATTKMKIELISPPNSLKSRLSTSSSGHPVKVEEPGSCSMSLGLVTSSTSRAGDGKGAALHQTVSHASHALRHCAPLSSPQMVQLSQRDLANSRVSFIHLDPVVLTRITGLPTAPGTAPLVVKQEQLSPKKLKRKRKSFCSGDVIDLTKDDDDDDNDLVEHVSLLAKRRRN